MVLEGRLDLCRHQRGQQRRAAAVGNVQDVGPGDVLEQLVGEEVRGARTVGAVVEASGLRTQQVDELTASLPPDLCAALDAGAERTRRFARMQRAHLHDFEDEVVKGACVVREGEVV